MGACTGLTLKRSSLLHIDFAGKVDTGSELGVVIGTFVMPASYDTNGSILDLSSVFNAVPDIVVVTGTQGVTFDYVAGTTAALGKIKAYSAVSSHTHDLLVTGSSGVTDGTQALQFVTGTPNVIKKNAASNLTMAGGASNIQATITEIAAQVASTTDLHTLTVSFVAYGNVKVS